LVVGVISIKGDRADNSMAAADSGFFLKKPGVL
jgi:hypothetical protein